MADLIVDWMGQLNHPYRMWLYVVFGFLTKRKNRNKVWFELIVIITIIQ